LAAARLWQHRAVSRSDHSVENEFLIGGNERRVIVLVDYDSSCPARFDDEWAKITTALGTEAIRIEHIGSTAVPGLAAKPIIDVLVTVADVEDEPRYLPALQRAGYVLRVREPGHRMVRTPDLDVHVQIWPDSDPAVTAHLALRNRLRSNTTDCDLYAATKRRLAQQDWPTMDHYADAKTGVILQILGRTSHDQDGGSSAPR
jgi:GrpB-like predicted nucleotidyltransferase (UPF0157 family)